MLIELAGFLTSLEGLLGEALDGSGRLVFLGGEAGIGNTTLAAALDGQPIGAILRRTRHKSRDRGRVRVRLVLRRVGVFVTPLDHAIDPQRNLVREHIEVRFVPFAEPHRIAVFRRDDADETVANRQRNHQHALCVGEAGQRDWESR